MSEDETSKPGFSWPTYFASLGTALVIGAGVATFAVLDSDKKLEDEVASVGDSLVVVNDKIGNVNSSLNNFKYVAKKNDSTHTATLDSLKASDSAIYVEIDRLDSTDDRIFFDDFVYDKINDTRHTQNVIAQRGFKAGIESNAKEIGVVKGDLEGKIAGNRRYTQETAGLIDSTNNQIYGEIINYMNQFGEKLSKTGARENGKFIVFNTIRGKRLPTVKNNEDFAKLLSDNSYVDSSITALTDYLLATGGKLSDNNGKVYDFAKTLFVDYADKHKVHPDDSVTYKDHITEDIFK